MKHLKSLGIWLKEITKATIIWFWQTIIRISHYLLETSFKVVFWFWGMVLLTIFTLASSMALMIFAGSSYSSTPQAKIAVNQLKPTIIRASNFAGEKINQSLDFYEKHEKEFKAGKCDKLNHKDCEGENSKCWKKELEQSSKLELEKTSEEPLPN